MFDPASPKTTGYHLFFEPSDDNKLYLDSIIAQLAQDHAGPVFDSHVTLLSRIELPSDEMVLDKAAVLAQKIAEFEVTLTKVEIQPSYFRSLYYKTELEPIMTYHTRACDEFELPVSDVYLPHLSLFYGLIADEEKQAIIAALPNLSGYSFAVNTLSVYRTPGEVGTWKKIGECRLTKG